MIAELLYALGQVAFGFVLACVILFLIFVAPWVVVDWIGDRNKHPFYEFDPADKAELRSGGWMYYDTYFETIERFRNDFA